MKALLIPGLALLLALCDLRLKILNLLLTQ